MFGKLKKLVNPSYDDLQKKNLKNFGYNQKKKALEIQEIMRIYVALTVQKKLEFIEKVLTGILSEHWIYKLKSYIIIHRLIQQQQSFYLKQRLDLVQFNDQKQINQHDITTIIDRQIILPYHKYVIKLCSNRNLIYKKHVVDQKEKLKQSFIEQINYKFIILNTMREILQQQIIFCKMGRYYFQYNIIFIIFKEYLKDMKIYYKIIMDVTQYILESFQNLNDQQIVHGFQFINDAIAISDKIFEFFRNIYFYPKLIEQKFRFPVIYKLPILEYKKMIKNLHRRKIFIDHQPKEKKNTRQTNKHFAKTMITNLTCETLQNMQNYNLVTMFQEQYFQEKHFQFLN